VHSILCVVGLCCSPLHSEEFAVDADMLFSLRARASDEAQRTRAQVRGGTLHSFRLPTLLSFACPAVAEAGREWLLFAALLQMRAFPCEPAAADRERRAIVHRSSVAPFAAPTLTCARCIVSPQIAFDNSGRELVRERVKLLCFDGMDVKGCA
jgi:hypothetical protein